VNAGLLGSVGEVMQGR